MPQPSTAAKVMVAILETIMHEGEQGAPESPMFLSFQESGLTLKDFKFCLISLETTGLIRRVGHTCYATPEASKLFAEAQS